MSRTLRTTDEERELWLSTFRSLEDHTLDTDRIAQDLLIDIETIKAEAVSEIEALADALQKAREYTAKLEETVQMMAPFVKAQGEA